MPYIPKAHEKYNLLPFCRENGGEVFSYSSEMEDQIRGMLPEGESVIPYCYNNYEVFYASSTNMFPCMGLPEAS